MRLLLDENLPPAFARSLDTLSATEGHSVAHLRDFTKPSTPDADWIARFGSEGDWVVVSGDRRMLTRKHELKALRDHRVTTFILAPGWSRLTFWDKAWLLVRWWPTVLDAAGKHSAGAIFVVPHKHAPSDIKPYP